MVEYFVYTIDTEYQWEASQCNDYENVVVSVEGTWTGNIEFWGTNDEPEFIGDFNWVKWALNDSVNASSTAVVTAVAGTTPTEVSKAFRGSIAGLRSFGIYADAGFAGSARVVVSYQRSAK